MRPGVRLSSCQDEVSLDEQARVEVENLGWRVVTAAGVLGVRLSSYQDGVHCGPGVMGLGGWRVRLPSCQVELSEPAGNVEAPHDKMLE